MMWYYGHGALPWLWMILTMLIFWGGLAAVVVWAIRSGLGSRRESDAMDVLRRRLAAGEITPEDFEKTKRILQG